MWWMNPIFYPKLPVDYDLPPTIYSLLNSIVNFDSEENTPIKNLAKSGRQIIFDFDYPLSDKIEKEKFEEMILNNFMMRRIGYETLTAFKLALNVKLNEIMPVYNKLFDSFDGWNILNDGEVTTTTLNTSSNGSTGLNSESDRRYSESPQGRLNDVKSGTYLTDYNLDTTTSNSTSSDTSTQSGTITKSPADKIKIYNEYMENVKGVYTLIFKDLEELFYFLV